MKLFQGNDFYHICLLTLYEHRYILAGMIERIVQYEAGGGLPRGIGGRRHGAAIAAPVMMEVSKRAL